MESIIDLINLQSLIASHKELLLKTDLPLISKCRDIATICHLFKIVHGLCSSPNPFKPHPWPNLWNLNSCALDPHFCWLTLSQRSFYPDAPTLWIYHPQDIVQCSCLSSFKTTFHSHLVCFLFCHLVCLLQLVLFGPI